MSSALRVSAICGLSPRVRGNHVRGRRQGSGYRSIPACAGEPSRRARLRDLRRVYPRVCGGTPNAAGNVGQYIGLSPRVRGNHRRGMVRHPGLRSIPACAGEPAQSRRQHPYRGGLSPRVRGNLVRERSRRLHNGSIPACAGEPVDDTGQAVDCRVYPRVCGGTPAARCKPWHGGGLSPRVRGNPGRHGRRALRDGSIPACAGEPDLGATLASGGEVYPRVCGGTVARRRAVGCHQGLSPRVRGNRLDRLVRRIG